MWDVLVVGGGPAGRGGRVLARRGRAPRARGREEAVPAREDLRRRPHAAGRPPAPRHGPRRAARGFLRFDGLRSIAHGVTLELRVARAPRLPRPTATSCAAATSTRWSPTPPVKAGRDAVDRRRGGRAAGRGRPGHRRGRSRRDGTHRAGAGALRGGGRRRELALRPGARHRPRPHRIPLGHGGAGLLHQPVPRRAVDREPPRPARPRRQPPARLRLDLPGGRRHRERRRRAAVDVLGVEVDQHQHADGRVRRDRAGALGHLARDVVRRADRRQAARPAGRSRRTSGPPGSWSATPPVR